MERPRELIAEQLYPPEPPISFPPSVALADQLYPPEPPISFPPLVASSADALQTDAATRGLRAKAQALTADDLTSLSVGHAKDAANMDPSQLYIASGLLLVVVGAVLVAVMRRKDPTKKQSDPHGRSVEFADSYEPFLG